MQLHRVPFLCMIRSYRKQTNTKKQEQVRLYVCDTHLILVRYVLCFLFGYCPQQYGITYCKMYYRASTSNNTFPVLPYTLGVININKLCNVKPNCYTRCVSVTPAWICDLVPEKYLSQGYRHTHIIQDPRHVTHNTILACDVLAVMPVRLVFGKVSFPKLLIYMYNTTIRYMAVRICL